MVRFVLLTVWMELLAPYAAMNYEHLADAKNGLKGKTVKKPMR